MKPVYILLSALLLISSKTLSQCDCDHVISNGNSTLVFDGNQRGVQPGDVICLSAGFRLRIIFRNIVGTEDDPVVLKNCGGLFEIGGPTASNAMQFTSSRYFHITGTGDASIQYGISILGSRSGSQGVLIAGLSSDVEIDHLEITGVGFAGVMAKSDPSSNCNNKAAERPNFTMYNIILHDLYIHDIVGEGLYVGNSFYTGTTVYCGQLQYPHEVRNVQIYNNLFENTGWESIQVGAAVENVNIYNNRIYNYGTADRSAQNNGIQLGRGNVGRVYNNFIKGGFGHGIIIAGIGENYIYNNIIIDAGDNAVHLTTRPTPLSTDIVDQGFLGGVYIINNTIINPRNPAVRESVNEAPGNRAHNNLIIGAPNDFVLRGDSDWTVSNNIELSSVNQARFVDPANDNYALLSTSPAIGQGADLSSFGVVDDFVNNARPSGSNYDVGAHEFQTNDPTCDAGPNRTITLPTSSTTLNGLASSPNGSITAYNWTKSSGGSVTLQNENTANLQLSALLEGIYQFQFAVTDNIGLTCSDNTSVTVVAPANNPPTANSGPNRTLTLPTNSLTINGSGFDSDGTITNYSWNKNSGPSVTISGANNPNLQLSNLVEGVYVFRLTVTDDDGATATDNVTITVNAAAVNQPPSVNAGPNLNLFLPTNFVNINATASDADGSISSYLWEKRSGPTVNLLNANNANVSLQNLVEGVYIFRVTVTDNQGATNFDEVQVSVSSGNQAPNANAGTNQSITLPTNTVVLSGSGSDVDGTIVSYQWIKVSALTATLANENTANLTVNEMVQGVHIFGLTVTDDDGATGYDEVQVTVNAAPVNQPPMADAGSDINITLPQNSVSLVGSGNDTDGTISSYSWVKASGPTANLSGANTANLSVTEMIAGSYQFVLTVTDNDGATDTDDIQITVFPEDVNQTPIANAGGNKVITLPINFTILNGAGTDPDGTIASFAWSKVSGPAATLAPNNNVVDVTGLVAGVYVFQLEVTDNEGATGSDFATVTVTASNLPPNVDAGEDQIIILPTNSTTINAIASDPDGVISNYNWVKTVGGAATLSGENTPNLNVSNLVQGDYIFSITVTDDDGSFSSDDVSIMVLPNGSNLPPMVNAGADLIVFLPTNSVNITANATDGDGTIDSYSWTKISGPATLVNAGNQTVTINNLDLGINEFQVTVADNNGATNSDNILVIVNPETTNQAPTADAGGNKNIQLPINNLGLNGSGFDVDGVISTYEWTKVSGPSVTITNSSGANVTLSDMIEGVYVFRLTITDNSGATAFDEAIVNVLPADVNQAPLADAGGNQALVLPQSNTNLLGLASDVDGSVVSYSWTKISGPAGSVLTNDNLAVASLSGLTQGTYIYRLTVVDDDGATGSDEVQITVSPEGSNVPPRADAGGNQVLTLPTNSINLVGSGSDSDGTVISYSWVKVSGGAANLINSTNPTATLTGLNSGNYVFRLRVTDNDGAFNDDFVNVVVNAETVNIPPIVNSGPDKTIFLPNNTTNLIGTASDQDGQITSILWEKVSGPVVTLGDASQNNLLLSGLVEGSYLFRLTAEDDDQASAYDEMNLTVLPVGTNAPPTIDLDSEISLFLPSTEFTIDVTTSDSDGSIASYIWSKVSGGMITLVNIDEEDLIIRDFEEGQYILQLNVFDNMGAFTAEQVLITVFPEGVNQPPLVDSGEDIELILPENQVILNGSAIDNDGTIETIIWQKVLGPTATLSGENSLNLNLTNLVEGRYTFSLTATDNEGASTSDDVKVNVNPVPPNSPPIVNAGFNVSTLLPSNGITFNGQAEDEDGEVTQLEWSQTQGSTVTLTGVNDVDLVVSDINEEGLYAFRLTAFDNEGASSFDDVFLFASLDSTESFLTNILSYELPGQITPSIIDFENNTILVQLETGTNLSSLVAEYELTDGAIASINGIVQESGVTSNDFNTPLAYTISVPDAATSKDWIVTVELVEGISTPKYFSPNNDGVADLWEVQNIELVQSCKLEIFSRSGQLVFEALPYENNWDGTSNGTPLQEEDYYYVFSCDGTKIKAGGVRIIR